MDGRVCVVELVAWMFTLTESVRSETLLGSLVLVWEFIAEPDIVTTHAAILERLGENEKTPKSDNEQSS